VGREGPRESQRRPELGAQERTGRVWLGRALPRGRGFDRCRENTRPWPVSFQAAAGSRRSQFRLCEVSGVSPALPRAGSSPRAANPRRRP